ncbi:MAG: HAD family hydrolase, partial [Halanaerobiaceae bacterium]
IVIENIIFDLGNVFFDFLPEKYLAQKYDDSVLVDELTEKIFYTPEWKELDRGNLDNSRLVQKLTQKHPELEEQIRHIGQNWEEMLELKEETVKLLEELDQQDYSLYILSNISEGAFNYLKNRYQFLDLFSGAIISGKLGVIKPEAEIYEKLITRFQLKPQKSVFLDDRRDNIEEAKKQGLKTIHFTDISRVRKQLEEYNVL